MDDTGLTQPATTWLRENACEKVFVRKNCGNLWKRSIGLFLKLGYASYERPDIQSKKDFSIACFDIPEETISWLSSCRCKTAICADFGGETCSHFNLAASRNVPASL